MLPPAGQATLKTDDESIAQLPIEAVSSIGNVAETLPPPLHPLAPAPETFPVTPRENKTPKAGITSIVEPPTALVDETNTSVSTIADDPTTNRADTEEGDFIEGVEKAHKTETITAL